jgi:hypothetical protein
MAILPLAVWTADNTVITADTIGFTADGSNLFNGGASILKLVIGHGPSYMKDLGVATQIYGVSTGLNTPLPVVYPAQTYYNVNGATRQSGM